MFAVNLSLDLVKHFQPQLFATPSDESRLMQAIKGMF